MAKDSRSRVARESGHLAHQCHDGALSQGLGYSEFETRYALADDSHGFAGGYTWSPASPIKSIE